MDNPSTSQVLQPDSAAVRATDPGLEALSKALRASFRLLQILILFLLCAFLASGSFQVEDGEIGFVLHMGKIRQKIKAGTLLGPDILKPGLHWAWPAPIDKHIIVPSGEQNRKVDAFWYNEEASYTVSGHKRTPKSLAPGIDGYSFTGDRNILHTSWSIRYRINNPVDYFMATDNKTETFQTILESFLSQAVIHTVSKMTIDQAFLTQVEDFRNEVKKRLEKSVRNLSLGVRISGVELVRNAPPRQTKDAFDAAINAGNRKRLKIDQAKTEANRITQNSAAESISIEAQAVADRTRIVLEAEADAHTFSQLLPEYRENRDGLLQQLYMEGVSEALASAKERFIFSPDKEGARKIRIELESQTKFQTQKKKEDN